MSRKIPSEFVPLDVNYAHDASIREAGPLAELLFLRSLAYCRRTKSEGFIPDYDLAVVGVGIPNPRKHAQTLTRVGIWLVVDRGFSVRSWAKWNPSTTREVKEKQSQGGVVGNHNRWHVNGVTSSDCPLCPSASDRSTDRSTDRSPISGERSVSDRVAITEVEIEEERETKTRPSAAPPDMFDRWWNAWPKKEAKAAAKRAYTKALKDVDADELFRLTGDWFRARRGMDQQFIPLPASWLNGKRWEDGPPARSTGTGPTPTAPPRDQWMLR